MKCKNGCLEGHSIYISECSSYSSYFDFAEIDNSDEIMIKASGENLCFERVDRTISLATCDETMHIRGWDIPTFVSYRPNQFYFMEYPLHIVNILTFSCVQVYGILTDSIADEPSNWGQ